MLEEKFEIVYTKFKLHFYQEIFERFQNREASLTTVETFAMETIQALGSPTVNEFASFMKISPPNAAYKINSLIRKGYIQKIQSEHDKREYHLQVTQKYKDYYNISNDYVHVVTERMRQRFTPEGLTGLLAFWAGQLDKPEPVRPAELAKDFDWAKVPAGDITIDPSQL